MIGNLDSQIEMLDILAVDAVESYHDPAKFFTYSQSLIQGFRNFTFAVQANKKQIDDFDEWYEPWRKLMKNDPKVNWVVETRNKVVKRDVIASKSYAKIFSMPDYSKTEVEEYFDYRLSHEEVIQKAKKVAESNTLLAHTVMQIERRYTLDVNGKEEEAAKLFYYVFYFFCLMYEDLRIFIENKSEYESPPKNVSEFINKATSINDDFRFVTFKAKSGEITNLNKARIDIDDDGTKIAQERYDPDKTMQIVSNDDDPEVATLKLFDVAKRMLKTDGFYVPMVFIKTESGYEPLAFSVRDRSEKILFTHQLGQKVLQSNATAVIAITESWTASQEEGSKQILSGGSISGLETKGEALSAMMIEKPDKGLSITTHFKRQGKSVELEEDIVRRVGAYEIGFLLPIYRLWRAEESSEKK